MTHTKSTQFRILYGSVVGAGLAILSIAGYRLIQTPAHWTWLLLSLLTLVAGSLSLRIPGVNGRISVGDTLICMSVFLFGPLPGAVSAALEGIAGSLRCRSASRRFKFLLFNAGAMALSAYAAGQVFCAAHGQPLLQVGHIAAANYLPGPLILFAATYFAVNTLLVAAAAALEKSARIFRTWRDGFLWTCVNYLAATFISGMIVQISDLPTISTLATVIAGCAGVYLSARAYVGTQGKPGTPLPLP
jgi:uncharacterized membrane protein